MLLFILCNKSSQHYDSRCPVIWVYVTTVTHVIHWPSCVARGGLRFHTCIKSKRRSILS